MIATVCAALLVGVAGTASAAIDETSKLEDAPAWAYAMAHELMSPYCPGRTLAECPSPQATSLRFKILMQAASGASEAEVREMLAQQYGDVLLAAPRAEGWGLSAYVIPIAFFLLGGPVVILIIRRLTGAGHDANDRKAATPPAQAAPIVDAELESQLEKELAEF